jgi:hypothetical protein
MITQSENKNVARAVVKLNLVFSTNYTAASTKTEVLLEKSYVRSLKISDVGAL